MNKLQRAELNVLRAAKIHVRERGHGLAWRNRNLRDAVAALLEAERELRSQRAKYGWVGRRLLSRLRVRPGVFSGGSSRG